ncbi:MAG: hypothetical protein ACI4OL_06105 [Gemmiger sp.]
MRGILIDPGAKPVICRLPDTEAGLYRYLGGQPHRVPFGEYPAALLHAGLNGQALPCRRYMGRWYYGRLIIVGYKSCRLMPLPEDLAAQMARQWADVEVTTK